jgi:hypothetical protein
LAHWLSQQITVLHPSYCSGEKESSPKPWQGKLPLLSAFWVGEALKPFAI